MAKIEMHKLQAVLEGISALEPKLLLLCDLGQVTSPLWISV